MGKQVRFYANRAIIESINGFAAVHYLKFVHIISSPDHDDWKVTEMQILDTTALFAKSSFGIYQLVRQEVEVPVTKEQMIAFMVNMNAFIEVSLFMKEATGYDSRIWFETPGHELDKEANALLRKIRRVVKKSQPAGEAVASRVGTPVPSN